MFIDTRCLAVAAFSLVAVLNACAVRAQGQGGDVDAQRTIALGELEWALDANGENIKWPEAVAYCADLELGGHSDWRLPTLEELENLHDPDAESGESIRGPFSIGDCCLWSGESLVDRPAEDGDEIAGEPGMYHWGFMFDGGLRYYAVHIFDDGRALCTRDAG